MLSVLMLKLATGQDRAWILRAAGDGMGILWYRWYRSY